MYIYISIEREIRELLVSLISQGMTMALWKLKDFTKRTCKITKLLLSIVRPIPHAHVDGSYLLVELKWYHITMFSEQIFSIIPVKYIDNYTIELTRVYTYLFVLSLNRYSNTYYMSWSVNLVRMFVLYSSPRKDRFPCVHVRLYETIKLLKD